MGRFSAGFNTYLTRSLKLKTEVDQIFIGHFIGNPGNATDQDHSGAPGTGAVLDINGLLQRVTFEQL